MNAATLRRWVPRLCTARRSALAAQGRAPPARLRRRAATPAASPRRIAALPAALLAAVLLAGCQPYVQGNGILGTETRNVQPFDAISVTDGIQLQVTAGAAQQSVVVSGDENVVQHVETSVAEDPQRGAVLRVKSTIEFFDSVNPLKAVVTVPALRALSAAKASPVTATGVASPTFSVDASDGVQVTLSGSGGATLDVALTGGQHGGAVLHAAGYPVDTATVALDQGAAVFLASRVRVDGTAAGGSHVENVGATCDVELSGGATAQCGPAP